MTITEVNKKEAERLASRIYDNTDVDDSYRYLIKDIIAAALQAKDDERDRAVKEAREKALDNAAQRIVWHADGEYLAKQISALKERTE